MSQETMSAARAVARTAWKTPSVDQKTLLSAGSVLAALGALACCVGPLVLLSFGVTGAWLANFNALYPYKPYLIATALLLLAARYVRVYRKRRDCGAEAAEAKACASAFATRVNKSALWVSTALIAAAIGLPYAAPWLLRLL